MSSLSLFFRVQEAFNRPGPSEPSGLWEGKSRTFSLVGHQVSQQSPPTGSGESLSLTFALSYDLYVDLSL